MRPAAFSRGFTLIEMSLAIGLTAVVVGTGFSAVYAISAATCRNEAADALAMEADFLSAKIAHLGSRVDGAALAYSDLGLHVVYADGSSLPLNGGGVRVESFSTDQSGTYDLTLAAACDGQVIRRELVGTYAELL